MNDIRLEEWEEICPICKGETKKEYGFKREFIEVSYFNETIKIPCPIIDESEGFCFECMGTGKITWLDKIMRGENERDED